ncbi:DUF2182 domain-containing protein [Jiella marina]|uniref:DUF2182 domain-containing protein n=1 Tax=Jiella sp. LLJ827 TaxID=2917712 RepID=UPI0021016880|nr:DUF2182 domain-containing protein [Jiella sp. LLJ827]MCQ0986883.1 DUF2182 domain-containing protein [Jiella sp. LLJ827]
MNSAREAGTFVETLLRRDRSIVIAGLVAITLLAWVWLHSGAGTGMSLWAMSRLQLAPGVGGMPMPVMSWSGLTWVIMVAMWWIMMIAMMTPSAAPMILLHARVTRHAQSKGRMPAGIVPSGLFLAGYLAVWLVFSVVATALQWSAEQALLLSQPMMWSTDVWLAAGLLIAAGIYQLSPFKTVCLEHCRAPAEFLSRHWRPGPGGALRMGMEHGAYCLGCCWSLMALLFVGGIMNVYWIAGLAIVVLLEKLMPRGDRFARFLGPVLIAAGLWTAIGAL